MVQKTNFSHFFFFEGSPNYMYGMPQPFCEVESKANGSQISDKFWCERPGFPSANVCSVSCSGEIFFPHLSQSFILFLYFLFFLFCKCYISQMVATSLARVRTSFHIGHTLSLLYFLCFSIKMLFCACNICNLSTTNSALGC